MRSRISWSGIIPSAPSDRIDWGKLWHLDQISVRQAWENTKGERDVVIAVVDDGCDLSHPAFGGPDKVVHPTDFVDGDAKPSAIILRSKAAGMAQPLPDRR